MKVMREIIKFRFQPTKDTWLAFGMGSVVILLSYSLNLLPSDGFAEKILTFLILTLGIRIGLGYYFPLRYELLKKGESLGFFGITKRRWVLSLVINIIFAGLLLGMFLSEAGEGGMALFRQNGTGISVYYILMAGIFEMIFIYGFLRVNFERAFGVLPSLVLTALFYSFYHAGFQPEFSKLFFVGLLYCATFRLTGNVLIIFPFFWGVGATWDVLVNFGATELANTWVLAESVISTLLMMGIFAWIMARKKRISLR